MKPFHRIFFIAMLAVFALFLVLASQLTARADTSPTIVKNSYGTTNGQNVDEYVLNSGKNMEVRVITYGGIITSVKVPDKDGKVADIVLGFNNLDDYVNKNSPHFGAMIGRYANRIAKGTFDLNGASYCLDPNNGVNTLHGGYKGFDSHVWDVTKVTTDTTSASLTLHYLSPDGDGWTGQTLNPACKPGAHLGFPGNLDTSITYTLNDKNQLILDYKATTDATTVVNLCNHSYWNLEGEGTGSIYDHVVTLNADKYTPVDSTQIPTGEIKSVVGTLFDFEKPKEVGLDVRANDPQLVIGGGFDHNWVINAQSAVSGTNGVVLAATVTDPNTSRVLKVWTNQPAIQFYTGNSLDGTLYGTSNHEYRESDGLALETQHYPDSPNHPDFPTTTLNPGETFTSETIYDLSGE